MTVKDLKDNLKDIGFYDLKDEEEICIYINEENTSFDNFYVCTGKSFK